MPTASSTEPSRRPRRPLRSAVKQLAALVEAGRPRRPGPRILIYHQVGTSLGREMEVPLAGFLAQLDVLAAEGRIVSLEEAVARIGTPGDDRLFVLTFDDGYADVYHNAFPHLVDRSLPFTVYLTTAPIEAEAPLLGHPEATPLRWPQVREMVASGLVTVGAHTHRHPDLRALDPTAVAEELDRSNGLIEERLGLRPRHFAYPKGWWAPQAEPEIRRRYDTAVLGEGPPLTAATDPFRLHRVAVLAGDGMRFFCRKLETGLVLEERLRRVVRRYRGPSPA